MAQQFAVFHAMKGKGSGGQLGKHIDRSHQVRNADPQQTPLNQYVVLGSEGKAQILNQEQYHRQLASGDIKSMYTAVNHRISEGYQGKTAIRKDAVRYVNLMLGGSHEQMKELEKQGKLEDWMKQNYRFVAKEFGKENIVRFAMHVDELTPHIHATVVPLTKDGRLSAKEYLFGHKDKLKGFQDRYAKEMKPFGLARGIEGSRVKHTTTMQYYKEQQHATQISLPQMKHLERRTGILGLGGKQEYYEVDKETLDSFVRAKNGQIERAKLRADMNGLKLSNVERQNKDWENIAKEMSENVESRQKLLQDVAQGKVSPQQVQEMFERGARQQEQEQRQQRQNRGRGMGYSL